MGSPKLTALTGRVYEGCVCRGGGGGHLWADLEEMIAGNVIGAL